MAWLEDPHLRVVNAAGSGMPDGRAWIAENHADSVVLEAVSILVVVIDLLGMGDGGALSPATPVRVDQIYQASSGTIVAVCAVARMSLVADFRWEGDPEFRVGDRWLPTRHVRDAAKSRSRHRQTPAVVRRQSPAIPIRSLALIR